MSSAPAPGGVAGTTSVYALDVGGVARSYRLFVPTQLPAGPRPLLMGLHSATRDGIRFETDTDLDANAAKGGVLVVYPDGLGLGWNAGTCCLASSATGVDDVRFLAQVIADVALRQPVDRLRTAVVGGSNGAMMGYRLACERSDLVDVVVAMGGAYVAPRCSFTRPVTLLHVHGLLDPLVPYLGGLVPSLSLTPFPATKGPVAGFAIMDGCKGSTSAPFNGSTLATLWQASACPAGTFVWLITSSTLAHTWSKGPVDTAHYGVDMTGVTAGFTSGVWATRGAPVPL